MTNPLISIKQCRMGTEHWDTHSSEQCNIGSMLQACILRLEKIVTDHHDRPTRERAKKEILLRDRLVRESE